MTLTEILKLLGEPNIYSTMFRLTLAVVCGGLIGLERVKKRRPAGFRTYMLVCLGAALTMIISQYLAVAGQTTDVSRLGAQVINGVGFLGAGTIIVTGRQQVKGLTTAAGLSASACMGLAIGAGFYAGALFGCVAIIVTVSLLSMLEGRIMSNARNMNIYIEFSGTGDIGTAIEKLKAMNVEIFDIEITKLRTSDGLPPSAILTIRLPKKLKHAEVMHAVSSVSGIQTVEEL